MGVTEFPEECYHLDDSLPGALLLTVRVVLRVMVRVFEQQECNYEQ